MTLAADLMLSRPDGSNAIFRHATFDRYIFDHLLCCLASRGLPCAASESFCDAMSRLEGQPGINVLAQGWVDDDERMSFARDWHANTPGAAAFDTLDEKLQKHLAERFNRHKSKHHWVDPSLPVLAPLSPLETSYLSGHRFSASVPFQFTMETQKANRMTVAERDVAESAHDQIARLAPLFDAAQAEWKAAKLRHPRANPFAKAISGFAGAAWSKDEPTEGLLGGSMWVGVIDKPEGLFFISPNGSPMREITRAKVFGSLDEAKAWCGSHRATACMELAWSPASYAPIHKGNHSLDKLFATKEAVDLTGSIVQTTPDPDKAPAPKKRRSGL